MEAYAITRQPYQEDKNLQKSLFETCLIRRVPLYGRKVPLNFKKVPL